ncbi:MAG: hypothetical protein K2Q23_03155 [Bryobacteraceae bacterium]|nr:hypothetical protein [Bryobacteraceae bacterium]
MVLLPVALGSFEVWRMQKARRWQSVAVRLATLLLGFLLMWWAIGSLLETRPPPLPVRLSGRALASA